MIKRFNKNRTHTSHICTNNISKNSVANYYTF